MRVPLSWLREYADLPDVPAGRSRPRWCGPASRSRRSSSSATTSPVRSWSARCSRSRSSSRATARPSGTARSRSARPRRAASSAVRRTSPSATRSWSSLPGAVLPGGFAIAARKTYGHTSDGMICSVRELGVGDEHDGILVLDAGAKVGADAVEQLALRDDVLDIAVTPDRGYCLSMRGVAREAATAFGVAVPRPGRRRADRRAGARATRSWSTTRPHATGSCCHAVSRGRRRRPHRRCGCDCGCRWPASVRSRSPSTSPTT